MLQDDWARSIEQARCSVACRDGSTPLLQFSSRLPPLFPHTSQRPSSPSRRPLPRPLPCLQGYLAALGDSAVTEQLLRRFKEATNMTDEISALAALDRAGGRWGLMGA